MTEIGGTTPSPGAVPGSAVLRYAAFTDHGRGGNPAGVVLDAADLDEAARLAVAARVGYSETAFVEATGGQEVLAGMNGSFLEVEQVRKGRIRGPTDDPSAAIDCDHSCTTG